MKELELLKAEIDARIITVANLVGRNLSASVRANDRILIYDNDEKLYILTLFTNKNKYKKYIIEISGKKLYDKMKNDGLPVNMRKSYKLEEVMDILSNYLT